MHTKTYNKITISVWSRSIETWYFKVLNNGFIYLGLRLVQMKKGDLIRCKLYINANLG